MCLESQCRASRDRDPCDLLAGQSRQTSERQVQGETMSDKIRQEVMEKDYLVWTPHPHPTPVSTHTNTHENKDDARLSSSGELNPNLTDLCV